MKKFEIALAAALLICTVAAVRQADFSETCARVRADTLRLHIVANSDGEQDQRVKLSVRDALLGEVAALAEDAGDKAALTARAASACGALSETAARVLRDNGFGYGARAYITQMYFDERSYENVTLPAGEYTALRVELGAAAGRNWWCVLYPAICVGASSSLEGYDDAEVELVTGERCEVRFKLEEWLQSLRQKRAAREQ